MMTGMADVETPNVPLLDEQPTSPAVARGLADRIRRAGLTSWSLIGIGLLLYGVYRFLLSPISVVFAPIAIARYRRG
jgi:hypothetical protein